GLLADLTTQSGDRVLLLVEEPPREVPQARSRSEGAPTQQHTPLVVGDDGFGARHRIGVRAVAAGRADGVAVFLSDSLAAARTEPPVVESAHEGEPCTIEPSRPSRSVQREPSRRRSDAARA